MGVGPKAFMLSCIPSPPLLFSFVFNFEVVLLSYNVAQARLEFVILLPQLLSAGITGMCHYVPFIVP